MNARTVESLRDTHDGAARCLILQPIPSTLDDLIRVVEQQESPHSHLTPMLRATAGHLAMYFDKPPERIEVRELDGLRPSFRQYLVNLQQPPLKKGSIRSYLNFLRVLLARAKAAGWSRYTPAIEQSWDKIRAVLGKDGTRGVVDFAVRLGRSPADFSDADLDQWGEQQVLLGRIPEYVKNRKNRFRRAVSSAGLESQLPKVSFRFRQNYGIPIEQFPEQLRTQVETVIRWKTTPFVLGRRNRDRLRPISAKNLLITFSLLYGFARKYVGQEPLTLNDLVDQNLVGRWVEWCLNERQVCSRSLSMWLGMLATLGRCPILAGTDTKWVRQIISELPPHSEEKTREQKERKWKQYGDLEKVPDRILQDAYRMTDPKRRASLIRDALLTKWFLTGAWRQMNIREARLGPSASGGNIFKEQNPAFGSMGRPRSVEVAVQTDPNVKLWQVSFSSQETKTKHVVRCLLPSQLVPLLEDYVANHRPHLVKDLDPGKLFLTNRGTPFGANSIRARLSSITTKYAGRRVTPHLFRDVFAVAWLNDHPADFATLSRALWHRDVNTTMKIYGRNFDESYATRHIEAWLDERAL